MNELFFVIGMLAALMTDLPMVIASAFAGIFVCAKSLRFYWVIIPCVFIGIGFELYASQYRSELGIDFRPLVLFLRITACLIWASIWYGIAVWLKVEEEAL